MWRLQSELAEEAGRVHRTKHFKPLFVIIQWNEWIESAEPFIIKVQQWSSAVLFQLF